MPILPLEPFVFPNCLFDENSLPLPHDSSWWVLHTKPRAEKSLARRLMRDNISFFLPLTPRFRRASTAQLPLFPSYVFLHGDDDDRVRALESNSIVKSLPVADGARLCVDLSRIYRMMLSENPLHAENRLILGTLVEIVDGPLAGLTGKILRRGKQLRFYVEVDFLQRGVSVELEPWMFRPLQAGRTNFVAPE